MWDGSIAEIHVTTHRFELKPDTKPVNDPRYSAGTATRAVSQCEIVKVEEAVDIDP